MNIRATTIVCLTMIFLQALPTQAAEITPPKKLAWEGFRGGVYQSDETYLSGQPLSQDAMKQLKAEGFTTIINLRTPDEIADQTSTPIDELKESQNLGIDYQHLPAGGDDHPYSPETVSKLAQILDNSDGKVLLHCNSGKRATHLWVAYLIKHQELSATEAIALGRSANFGSVPLEGFLGQSDNIEHLLPAN